MKSIKSIFFKFGEIINNDELKILKGGTSYHCYCCVYDGDWTEGALLLYCDDGWGQSQFGCEVTCNQSNNPMGFSCRCW